MRLELVVLGTASQAPTRERGQGGYVLRWADHTVLFDPGEGCQRQLLHARISPARIDRVCITHFHGDHCLGLPGLVQSRALVTDRPLVLHYDESQKAHVDHLLAATVVDFDLGIVLAPMRPGDVIGTNWFDLAAERLEHPTPSLGYRLTGHDRRHLIPDELERLGIEGPRIRDLLDAGALDLGHATVSLDEVSEWASGPSMAFVMDTAPCAGAARLAQGVDLLVCEATFLHADLSIAAAHGHMTARQAATLAAEAGVGRLVLSHFSGRYERVEAFEEEAAEYHHDVVAARDFTCVRS